MPRDFATQFRFVCPDLYGWFITHLNLQRSDTLPEKAPEADTPTEGVFMVPARNPRFAGREAVLEHLHKALTESHSVLMTQALSGMGEWERRRSRWSMPTAIGRITTPFSGCKQTLPIRF